MLYIVTCVPDLVAEIISLVYEGDEKTGGNSLMSLTIIVMLAVFERFTVPLSVAVIVSSMLGYCYKII